MTLTKDDFFSHDIGVIIKGDEEQIEEQILKNQEIADKWNKVVGGHGLLTTPEEICKWKEDAEKWRELTILTEKQDDSIITEITVDFDTIKITFQQEDKTMTFSFKSEVLTNSLKIVERLKKLVSRMEDAMDCGHKDELQKILYGVGDLSGIYSEGEENV